MAMTTTTTMTMTGIPAIAEAVNIGFFQMNETIGIYQWKFDSLSNPTAHTDADEVENINRLTACLNVWT